MTSDKKLTLSIVIPVYNEQDYIGACLEAIARQTEAPDEVIIVDNNTTDKTLEIARSYSFIKIIKEPLQHQSFAQKLGFDEADGDIIGRIDGDTILPADWVARVKRAFEDNDVVAITGGGEPYDMFAMYLGRLGFVFFNWLASVLGGSRMLWGANCAIRASAWKKVSTKVLLRNDIWEDHDLSYCLQPLGKIRRIHGIPVGFSFRSTEKPFIEQVGYQYRSVRTVYLHRGFWRAVITFIVWCSAILAFPLMLFDRFILKPLGKKAGHKFGPKAYLNSRYSSARVRSTQP